MFNSELKRGSLELLILSVLTGPRRHGYEIGKLMEHRSDGKLEFPVSTLYSILYRMEDRGWIKGRWVEKKGVRKRKLVRGAEIFDDIAQLNLKVLKKGKKPLAES